MKNTEPKPSALARQEAGNHYKEMPIQPVEFCHRNRLGFCESSVIKYIARHNRKNGSEDVKKAIHFCELLLELEYEETKIPVAPQCNEDDLRILRDAQIDREAREIFPDKPKDCWISVKDRLPNDGQLVVAKYEGVYEGREVTFHKFGCHFGDHLSVDGKGSQPATHWKPAKIEDAPKWKLMNKIEIGCYPMTPCCGYAALTVSEHPVHWNPGNGVIQCHNCGHVYEPCAIPVLNSKQPPAIEAYHELIMAVESVHPGESRHQTALRYIKEHEGKVSNPAQEGPKKK